MEGILPSSLCASPSSGLVTTTTMRLSLVLLGLVLGLAPYVSSLFIIPIATTTTGAATTTTVGFSAASLATGAAVAAAGIVGLGLAAVAVAALSGGGDEECYGYGCGGGGHRGGGYHHKRRRDLNTDETDIDELFAMVAKMDAAGCGLRLVCYIYQKDPAELSQKERGVRALLGETPRPVDPKNIKKPRAAYQSAAFFGYLRNDCVELYHQCPLDSQQALKLLNQIDLHETGSSQ